MNNQKYHKLQNKILKSKRKRENNQMAFKMSFDKEELKGPQPVQPGIYKVRLIGFKPKISAKGNSINFNPQVRIVGGEADGKPIFTSLNSGVPQFIQDFVHSFGLELENGDSIPGEFAGTSDAPGEYQGPLLGKVAEWEVGLGEYQGKANNEIRRFICVVPNCGDKNPDIRHSTDMARKS